MDTRRRYRDEQVKPNGAANDEPIDLGEWDFGEDNEPIPPRGWLLGNLLCRQFLSSLFADGGIGKTALMVAMALSLATGRALIGEHVFLRCRVLLVCFEDGADELRRRLTAAMLHYNITKADILGYLFITTVSRSDAKLAHSKEGMVTIGKLRDALDRSITRRQADVVLLDPLIKTHSVGENSNPEMDFVAEILSALAIEHDCALCTPHHTRKGSADPGNADSGRGAGALKDAFRLCYTLSPMSKEEAEAFGVNADDHVSLIRLDPAKVNLVRHSANARWFKLVGVSLGNKTDLYPNGDVIQTVECWSTPDLFEGLSTVILNAILTEIDKGLPDGKLYSDHGKATDRAAWHVVTKHVDRTEPQARQIIKEWMKTGLLYHETYHDEDLRKDRQGLRVQATKRPGTIHAP